VTYNKDSWNSVANVLYLDRECLASFPRMDLGRNTNSIEPVGVGYSYSDEGEVNNSPAAAEDVYAFLMLFISQARLAASCWIILLILV
jgi:cathepsin A (carboxypeptidase C)